MLIYLDNIATTKVDPKVKEAMFPYFDIEYGNASSIHIKGLEASLAIEKARLIIAKKINAQPEEIIFTSGGTETNNLVLSGLINFSPKIRKHFIISNIEHPSVYEIGKYYETKGIKVTYVPVNRNGIVDPEDIKKAITNDTIFVSIMLVNNEIGTIQPICEIGKICREKGVYFHSDVCQGFTKLEVNVVRQNLDFATLNGHKVHGPKGVGALYMKKNMRISPLFIGGGQEHSLRPGTYNTPGIVGFGKAVEISNGQDIKRMTALRDYLINKVFNDIEDVILNGAVGDKRVCNNINLIFQSVDGKKIFMELNKLNIIISTGSACSSKVLTPSRVIKALGYDDQTAHGAIRIGISKWTTKKEIDTVIYNLKKIIKKERDKLK
jgi:cysteine desulfurase